MLPRHAPELRSAVALGEQSQTKRVELDEALGILLVALIICLVTGINPQQKEVQITLPK